MVPPRSEALIECAISNYLTDRYRNNEALLLDHSLREGVYIANSIILIKPKYLNPRSHKTNKTLSFTLTYINVLILFLSPS